MKTAETILKSKPSTKLGLDDFYGTQTVLKAMQELESQDKWVSVEERLPEKAEKVLIYCPEREFNNCDLVIKAYHNKTFNCWMSVEAYEDENAQLSTGRH